MKKLILILIISIGLVSCNQPQLISCEQIIIGIEKTDGFYCRYFFNENHYIISPCGKYKIGDTIVFKKK